MYTLSFFGTSAFAVPLLQALAEDPRFRISVVVTQPDRPVGRKQILTAPPVKLAAQALGIPVLQPERMKAPEALEALQAYAFDAAVVASYGQILPQAVLDLAPNRFINLHGSLLPSYRGASPIAEVIKQGETETGVTVMLMDALMDHGAMLAKAKTPITQKDTTATLEITLATLGAQLLPSTLFRYLEQELVPEEQPHDQATFCKLITKEDGHIDPTAMDAVALERLVRAYTPWPLVTATLSGERVKLLKTHVGEPTEQEFGLVCKEGTLVIDELRPEGKPSMSGAAFARGRSKKNEE